jgi:hypothetical protein
MTRIKCRIMWSTDCVIKDIYVETSAITSLNSKKINAPQANGEVTRGLAHVRYRKDCHCANECVSHASKDERQPARRLTQKETHKRGGSKNVCVERVSHRGKSMGVINSTYIKPESSMRHQAWDVDGRSVSIASDNHSPVERRYHNNRKYHEV